MNSMKLVFFLIAFLFVPVLLRAEESTVLRDANQKLALLESKISQLTASQSQVIQKLEQVNQELDSLRIWIRRNRN